MKLLFIPEEIEISVQPLDHHATPLVRHNNNNSDPRGRARRCPAQNAQDGEQDEDQSK